MTVYLKSSDSRYWKAQCDGTSAEASIAGIALTGSSAGQSLVILIGGSVTIGGTVAAATQYVVSATAGGLCPIADLASMNFMANVCYGTTTAIVVMNKLATGIQKA